jgi:hypothetical protein
MESDSSRSTPTRQHNLLTSTLRTHTRMLLLALLTSTCLLTLTSAQPSFDSSTGAVQPDNFNPSDIPLSPPENIIYGDKGCQFIQQWDGPQCAAGFECISETLAAPQEENDDKFHLTYQQEQCLFCIFSSYCSPRQKDACKQLSVIEPDFNIANIVNRTLGVGTCKACKEGQYCPATTGTNATATTAAMASKGSINPFGLAIINLCAEGSYCPSSTQQLTCPQGFFCPMGTKFPFACTALGTFCAPGSNSPSKLCRGGRYCPDPQTEIECPSGHFCKAGAIAPKKCTVLASCPAGSAAALLVWQGIIFVILIYLALAAVYYTTRFIQKRRRKREAAAAAKRAEGAEVVQLLKSLRTFQNLEAMHAQQTGMTPHTGRGRNGYTPGGNSTTPMVSSGRGMAKAAAGGAFGAGMHGGDGAKTPDYGNKHSVAPEDVDYTIAKTVDGNFAVVKHSKEEESALVRAGIASPKDQTKEEVIGVVKNKHTVSHEHDTELVKAENHEDIGVVMPEQSVEHHVVLPMSARGANGQHSEQHADENDVEMTRSTPRNIPSAINIKTDADIDTGAAVNDDDDDDGDSVDEDEDDDLTGFDPIPIPVTLTFDKLGLKLKNGTEVLKGVSGEFPHSRLTALMGPSGAGQLCGMVVW